MSRDRRSTRSTQFALEVPHIFAQRPGRAMGDQLPRVESIVTRWLHLSLEGELLRYRQHPSWLNQAERYAELLIHSAVGPQLRC